MVDAVSTGTRDCPGGPFCRLLVYNVVHKYGCRYTLMYRAHLLLIAYSWASMSIYGISYSVLGGRDVYKRMTVASRDGGRGYFQSDDLGQ